MLNWYSKSHQTGIEIYYGGFGATGDGTQNRTILEL